MDNSNTPGVIVKETSLLPPSVAGVATAVPAFIGFTEKQTKKAVQPVSNLLEFQTLFGEGKKIEFDSVSEHITGQEFTLYDSMRLFFDNGGGDCYVVSIGKYENYSSDGTEQGIDILTKYTDAIDLVAQQPDVTLLVFPDAAMLLSADDLKEVHQAALDHCAEHIGRFAILDVKQTEDETVSTPSDQISADIAAFRNGATKNRCYGAAYYPYLKTSYQKKISFGVVVEALQKRDGDSDLLTLATTIANMPDATDDQKYAKQMKINTIIPQLDGYAEMLAELQDEASVIPPSGAVAGIYVDTDARAGVWQAPANVGIVGVKDLCIHVNDNQQGSMNVDTDDGKSVNAIRFFKGKGILVWGSRTVDGNSEEWKYVPVRRLFSYIEQSVKLSTSWAVFQPNDANTWVKVKCQISNFLSALWREGALTGASTDEAFFVEVGKGITMTDADIRQGILRVKIGLAAVRPAEFIILEFSHKVQE